MQMRLKCITGFAAQPDHLSFADSVADIYQGAVFLQMPVPGSRSICMLNNDVVAIRPEFRSPSAAITIFFYPDDYSISRCADLCSSFHIKIQRHSFPVTEASEITLHQPVGASFPERKGIHITGIVFNDSFLQKLHFFSHGIFADITAGKNDSQEKQNRFQRREYFSY